MNNPYFEYMTQIRSAPQAVIWYRNEDWLSVPNEDFYHIVINLSKRWYKEGVRKNDRVILLAENGWEHFAIELSLQLIGAVPLSLDLESFLYHAKYFLNEVKPVKVINQYPEGSEYLIQEVCAKPILKISNLFDLKNIDCDSSLEKYLRSEKVTTCMLVSSSGTTGTPKIIQYNFAQLNTAIQEIKSLFPEFNLGEKVISWLPQNLMFQRMVNRFVGLYQGQIYFVKDIWECMEQLKNVQPTIFIGVPLIYEKQMNKISTKSFLFKATKMKKKLKASFGGKVKIWMSGTSPLSKSTYDEYAALGVEILESYGFSENIMPVSMNTLSHHKKYSVGKPLSSNLIKINDDGEIFIKQNNNFMNCFGQSDSILIEKCGYYSTGDYGYIDHDGYLFLTGRKHDFIKTKDGRKIYIARIEEQLKSYTSIKDCFVSGHGGDEPLALIYTESADITYHDIARIVDKVNKNLLPFEQIKNFKIIKTPLRNLNSTEGFKLKRKQIETKYSEFFDELRLGLSDL